MSTRRETVFTYKNHRGEVALRRIYAEALHYHFSPNREYGYQPGWFLHGFDLDKQAPRSFALSNIILESPIRVDWIQLIPLNKVSND